MPDPAAGGVLGLAAWCGQVALLISLALIVVCGLRVWPRARRVRGKARVLQARVRAEQDVLREGILLLLTQQVQMDRLLQRWRRVWFWTRHPLTRALWKQYVGR